MAAVADDEPLSVEELASFVADGRAWVSTDEAERPTGYLLVDTVDGCAHIEQVSVHPDYARQAWTGRSWQSPTHGLRNMVWRP